MLDQFTAADIRDGVRVTDPFEERETNSPDILEDYESSGDLAKHAELLTGYILSPDDAKKLAIHIFGTGFKYGLDRGAAIANTKF